MPSVVPAVVLRDVVRTALQGATVATAAGVADVTWAAAITAGGRVFDGDSGFLGSRSRGRLPFVEIWVSQSTETQLSYEGGLADLTVQVRAHVGGRDQSTADALGAEILYACVRAIRDLADDAGRLGGADMGPTNLGPWGHQRDVSIRVQQAIEI